MSSEDEDDDIEVMIQNAEREMQAYKDFSDKIYGNYRDFNRALIDDVKEAKALLKSNNNQFSRRTYLRSFFAFVEGKLFSERLIIHEFINYDSKLPVGVELTDAERMLLQEVEYELNDNGTVKERNGKYQPFIKYLRFTINVWAKYHKKTNAADYKGSGWESFRTIHEVRNRITHPKSNADLLISDIEFAHLNAAVTWFVENT